MTNKAFVEPKYNSKQFFPAALGTKKQYKKISSLQPVLRSGRDSLLAGFVNINWASIKKKIHPK